MAVVTRWHMPESFPPGLCKHYTWNHVAEALMQYVRGKEHAKGERKGSHTSLSHTHKAA